MATTVLESNIYTLQIPVADKPFFLSLVKKMGWTAKKAKVEKEIPAETLATIEEMRNNNDAGTVDMSSLDSFIKSMQ